MVMKTAVSLTPQEDAARFLMQAGFGASKEEIEALALTNDYESWIDDQKTKPVSLTHPYMDKILGYAQAYNTVEERQANHPGYKFNTWDRCLSSNFSSIWMMNIVHGEDQLRQRIAWCLSQIFVISYSGGNIFIMRSGEAVARFYDLLSQHALGNYLDLLKGVSKNPIMAYYLTSLGNEKSIPNLNQYPDENYAREVMQLFSIGLWELNKDGTHKLDGQGEPIPTYDNDDITELARVFTGLWYEGEEFKKGSQGPYLGDHYTLAMFEDYHDQDTKTLFHGKAHEITLPANQGGMADIDAACAALFNHPNTAPFISKSLIRFLVTSNPSPAYVERIATVFENNGANVRGDLFAVVKAILLDTEARTYTPEDNSKGKLIEPMLRITRTVKAFNAGQGVPEFQFDRNYKAGQWPLASPSVFNFFEPGYSHGGDLRDAGLASPEFQILTSTTTAEFANQFLNSIIYTIHSGPQNLGENGLPVAFSYDFTPELALHDDPDALIDRLNLLLAYGQMKAETRNLIKTGINQFGINQPDNRLHMAVYLAFLAPESAILR